MIAVQFPPADFRMQKRAGKPFIFDAIRKRWVPLTEEEWVRQNMIAYLVKVLQYPKESIAVEKEILLNGMQKRFDMLVYDKAHQPWMMIECKAPAVSLSEAVLQQALRYNMVLPVRWILITNGEKTIAWQK
ncbi:MAG: type I restriction enzyme HsdR N-terminal domain-containing protein, partial [Chitinophagaceae bacterium]